MLKLSLAIYHRVACLISHRFFELFCSMVARESVQ